MTLRIAFARINQETNCLSPVSTSFADFESTHFLEGQDLDKAVSRSGFEVPGMFRRVELAGFMAAMREAKAEVLPIALFSAWAVPSGPLTRECFDELERRLVDGLKAAGRLDGVYLCLHGAMGVKGLDDPEGRLVTAAAEAALAPVIVTHDLHVRPQQAQLAPGIARHRLTKAVVLPENIDAAQGLIVLEHRHQRSHAHIGVGIKPKVPKLHFSLVSTGSTAE